MSELRGKFYHPYQPYDIQLQLMDQIYDTINKGKKVGIFESPTGTGKTLSVICSVVTWLREHRVDSAGDGFSSDGDGFSDDEPEWVTSSHVDKVDAKLVDALLDYEKYLDSLDVERKIATASVPATRGKRKRVEVEIEADFLPQDYVSDNEEKPAESKLGTEIEKLMEKIETRGQERKQNMLETKTKVFFASRTHSQLSQFSSQLKLPQFPSAFPDKVPKEHIRYLRLASRKQLCINPNVSQMSPDTINEGCKDAVATRQCNFYQREPAFLEKFRDYTFSSVHDIEDLGKIGRTLDCCPYYATRSALTSAEIVTLPYQLLLSPNSRESLGISLKDSIIVIDEAHNLIDTINSMNSASITQKELIEVRTALANYIKKFSKRLNGGNRVNLMKLLKVIDIISTYISISYKNGQEINVVDLLSCGSGTGDMFNIYKMEKYLKVSKVAFKIQNYINSETDDRQPHKQPGLFKIVEFLKTLTNPSNEGKLFFDKDHSIKYMLLEPSEAFKDVIADAKCVILAGGTMEPIQDFLNLVPYVAKEDIVRFSCKHVIPDSNLDVHIVKEGFEFSYEKRADESMVCRFGEFLRTLSAKVPYGIVVFVPSYQYLDSVMETWRKSGILSKLNSVKKVFCESSTQDVLSSYTAEIEENKRGAILLSVVGGKLSEGINFQDNLARAVVMVGLPYPNMFSGEMIFKRKHIEEKILASGGTKADAMVATREFYQNICMKAVNQSIGRAIRHINDYACIYLVDTRYDTATIRGKLSEWVRDRISDVTTTTAIMAKTESFFKRH